MKYLILVFAIILVSASLHAQDRPVEITPSLEKKMRIEVAKETAQLRSYLINNERPANVMEFTIDTFQVERYFAKSMSYNYSTVGMVNAAYEAAHKYDSLLNKYYKKLLAVLKPNDKSALINAQKAWITFRDSEEKLYRVISKEEYSGGGTIQQLNNSSSYLDMIRSRAIAIADYYLRATGSE